MLSEIKMKMKMKRASKMGDGRSPQPLHAGGWATAAPSEMGKWWKAGGGRVRERECERERGVGSQWTGMSGGIN